MRPSMGRHRPRTARASRALRFGRPLVLAATVLLVAAGGSGIAAAGTAPALQPVMLPRDHGAHPGFNVEWWYTAGTLADATGRDYFWFATIWSTGTSLVSRLNVVDLTADRIVLSSEFVSITPVVSGQTQLAVGGLHLGWRPGGAWGRWSVDGSAGTGGLLDLSLLPRQPYVLNGPHGIIEQGPGGQSAYYSNPRLAARGTLELNGKKLKVSGQGWLDHQWGNFATQIGSLRWNWFACQFQDGRDLMLYQFLNPDDSPSSVYSGTLVSRHGAVTHPGQFTAVPLGPSIRPAGATATYPLRWRLEVPSGKIVITLRARARNQFITNKYVPSFWEGAASITSGSTGTCIVESTREGGT